MIAVEAGHAHYHCHFLGEKCGDENFILFFF
jgi:hypothetical protein